MILKVVDSMKVKIFAPDLSNETDKKKCVPLFYPYPLLQTDFEAAIEKYGEWIKGFEFVDELHLCDIVAPVYYVNDYYKLNRHHLLLQMNNDAIKAGKLTVCWTNGDEGMTPPLKHFHLFRTGGYLHKNKGNEFCFPPFFADPVERYYDNVLPLVTAKPEKPLIGFCGQGRAGVLKLSKDIGRNIIHRILKMLHRRVDDVEKTGSPVYHRSRMLDVLERSPLVDTNFIRHKLYRAGIRNKNEREDSNRLFYANMKTSPYIFCYRGNGNFSVRLYETLASGRIPLMVRSDNNLPWHNKIDWNVFPQVPSNETNKIDQILADFHCRLSEEDFINLQKHARRIWEDYLSYKGFMKQFITQYATSVNM